MTSESPHVAEEPWWELSPVDQQAIHTIYEQTFPPKERRDLERVIATGCRLWTARRDHVLVGFTTAVALRHTEIALLQYLAVSPDAQSTGIGSTLLAFLSNQLATERQIKGILLEIEDPFDTKATTQTKSRLTFYEQWGAERVNCIHGYFMVDFSDPLRRIPMVLLWRPVVTINQPRGTVLRSALAAIFASEYADIADQQYLDDLIATVIC